MDQLILQYILPFVKKFRKNLLFCALIILYLVAFWLLFFTKGIYVNGSFYKKSANLTQISYTSASPFADFDSIVVQKYVDSTTVTVDDVYTITVTDDGSWIYTGYISDTSTLENIDWYAVAAQQTEQNRGFGTKLWIPSLLCLVFAVLAKYNSTKLYELFNKNKAANETYYKMVNTITTVIIIVCLVYFIIPV